MACRNGGLGQRMAHPAGGAVGKKTDGVDGFARRSCRDENAKWEHEMWAVRSWEGRTIIEICEGLMIGSFHVQPRRFGCRSNIRQRSFGSLILFSKTKMRQ